MSQPETQDVRAAPGTPFTSESAAAAGRESARLQRERRAAEQADPALAMTRALPQLFADLLKAAKGEAPFDTLPPDKRLAALFRAIEYGAGKPISRDKQLNPADQIGRAHV